MSRRRLATSSESTLYRAVVEHLTADGDSVYHSAGFGPYDSEAVAKRVRTERLNDATRNGRKAHGHVEVLVGEWRTLEEG